MNGSASIVSRISILDSPFIRICLRVLSIRYFRPLTTLHSPPQVRFHLLTYSTSIGGRSEASAIINDVAKADAARHRWGAAGVPEVHPFHPARQTSFIGGVVKCNGITPTECYPYEITIKRGIKVIAVKDSVKNAEKLTEFRCPRMICRRFSKL